MLVENSGLNRQSVLEQSLNQSGSSLKELSNKFKKNEKLSKIFSDSVEIRNSDRAITTVVRDSKEAEGLINSTKLDIEGNRKQAILTHSRLI